MYAFRFEKDPTEEREGLALHLDRVRVAPYTVSQRSAAQRSALQLKAQIRFVRVIAQMELVRRRRAACVYPV